MLNHAKTMAKVARVRKTWKAFLSAKGVHAKLAARKSYLRAHASLRFVSGIPRMEQVRYALVDLPAKEINEMIRYGIIKSTGQKKKPSTTIKRKPAKRVAKK
jgi:hypothetical protein